ncbi:hypothetical protein [Streptomyces sp. NPDC020681]|uniref:hypothetical protein n=1 Tax=Streptomyces sp. NPDC020681 TaxID=3365083 RepID=UPI00378766B8
MDHIVTRFRRAVESLAVLGGAVPRRINRPVPVQSLLRSAIAEIESYRRVRVLQAPSGAIHGHVAADIVHLLAELIENGTKFSPPDTIVHIRAEMVPAGLAVEIDDRGLLVSTAQRAQLNRLLANPEQFGVTAQLSDGRIGLYVVAQLAGRQQITVKVQTNLYGGNQAVVVLPRGLLSPADSGGPARQHESSPQQPSLTSAYATPRPDAESARHLTTPLAPMATTTQAGDPDEKRARDPERTGDDAGPFPAPPSHARAEPMREPSAEESVRPPLPRRSDASYLASQLQHNGDDRDEQDAAANPRLAARFFQGLSRAGKDEGSGATS